MTGLSCTPETLRAIPLFSALTEAQIESVLPHVKVGTYAADKVILRPGSIANGLYVITAGQVALLRASKDAREVLLEELREHDFFGEAACLQECASTETVRAQTSCAIAFVPRVVLLKCLRESASVAIFLTHSLVRRLSSTRQKMGSLALQPVYERVLKVLLERLPPVQGQCSAVLSIEAIATAIGASQESVRPAITDLIGRRLIRRSQGKIIVANRAALADYAQWVDTVSQTKTADRTRYRPDLRPRNPILRAAA